MVMDSSGFSEIGRYGTIRLMKRLHPDTPIAAFPLDDEEVTFGRDPACSVRLYYPDVSLLHCKIVFEDRKAFLVVLGTNGLFVDGCQVFPATNASSPSSGPTMIPLPNNSEIEIHNKRFKFTYPPKELRAALLATPSRTGNPQTPHRRRALRMSMILSAQVFSPRPSKDPRENLRVLQSPLKPFSTPAKPSALRHQHGEDQEDKEDEEIVLVDGNHPRVVEEEKDLVILEDVEVDDERTPTQAHPQVSSSPVRSPTKQVQFSVPSNAPPRTATSSRSTPSPPTQLGPPQPQPQQPQTPQRRFPRASLHKAVLIRSAQRAVMKAEIEREEEEEEKEVEDFIATQVAQGGSEEEQDSASASESDEEGSEEEEDEGERQERQKGISTWRRSLEAVQTRIWPFRSGSVSQDEQEEDSTEQIYDEEEYEPQQEHDHSPDPVESQTPQRMTGGGATRTLGDFMTPQLTRLGASAEGGRYSVGGGAARRVMVEQTWRVRDIVLPGPGTTGIKEEDEGFAVNEGHIGVGDWNITGVGRGRGRERLSDEERRAIQERRRSALRTPDPFFGGQAPGTRKPAAFLRSPSKAPEVKQGLFGPESSPAKTTSMDDEKVKEEDEEEELDTRSLLERMKETVEGMKRRRSMLPSSRASLGGNTRMSLGLGLSPRKRAGGRVSEVGGEQVGDQSFSLLAPGAREEVFGLAELGEDEEKTDDAMDVDAEESDKENEAVDDVEEAPNVAGAADSANADEEDPAPVVPPQNIPGTPRMDGMRQLFAEPRQLATPSFEGVEHMFRGEGSKLTGTPALEGVAEMMRTPERYQYVAKDEEDVPVHEDEPEVEEAIEVTVKNPPSKTLLAGRATRKPRVAALKDTPSLADDEATPGVEVMGKRKGRSGSKQLDSDIEEDARGAPKPKARLLRGKKVIEDITEEPAAPDQTSKTRKAKSEESEDVSEATGKSSKTKPSSRAKPKSEQSIEVTGAEVIPPAPPKLAARRGRKAAAESGTSTSGESPCNPDEVHNGTIAAPAKTPARRGRKPASASTTEGTSSVPPAKPVRKGRPPKAQDQNPAPAESGSEISTNGVRNVRAKGRAHLTDDDIVGSELEASVRRGTRAKPINIEADEDPLDSIGGTESEDIVAVPAKRRGARTRAINIEVIKEETGDVPLEPEVEGKRPAATRNTRGKKVPTPVPPIKAPTKARTKTALTHKSSAIPVTSATSEDGVDKENTPGSGSLDEDEVAEKPAAAKVTKSKKAAAKVKEEIATEVEVPTRTRVTRTRART